MGEFLGTIKDVSKLQKKGTKVAFTALKNWIALHLTGVDIYRTDCRMDVMHQTPSVTLAKQLM